MLQQISVLSLIKLFMNYKLLIYPIILTSVNAFLNTYFNCVIMISNNAKYLTIFQISWQ